MTISHQCGALSDRGLCDKQALSPANSFQDLTDKPRPMRGAVEGDPAASP